jgi:hypothetical protein
MTTNVLMRPRTWNEISRELLLEGNIQKMAALMAELLKASEYGTPMREKASKVAKKARRLPWRGLISSKIVDTLPPTVDNDSHSF